MTLFSALRRPAAPPPGSPAAFAADVVVGLSRFPREVPSVWVYDARGSALYDRVTETADHAPPATSATTATYTHHGTFIPPASRYT